MKESPVSALALRKIIENKAFPYLDTYSAAKNITGFGSKKGDEKEGSGGKREESGCGRVLS